MGSRQRSLVGLWLLIVIVGLPDTAASQEDRFNFNKTAVISDKSGIKDADKTDEELFKYTSTPLPKYEFNLLGLLLKTILALGVITGILYFILKFFFRGRSLIHPTGDFFRVIGSHALAPNKYIQLVEVGNNLILLGITENGINLLTEINDQETIDLIKTQASQTLAREAVSFSHQLREFLKRFRQKDLYDESLEREKKITFLKDQRAKLRRLNRMTEDR